MSAYSRIGQVILLTFVALLVTDVTAKTAENIDAFVGQWSYAGMPDVSPGSIKTTAAAANLNLVLPDKMKLRDEQMIVLSRVNATTFSANDKSGTVVKFTLKSPGKAELIMKGYGAGRWTYLDTDLTRE
jgi:hypothetical protein